MHQNDQVFHGTLTRVGPPVPLPRTWVIICHFMPWPIFSNPYSYVIDPEGSKIALTGLIYFTTLLLSLTCYKCYLDIGTLKIQSVPLPYAYVSVV